MALHRGHRIPVPPGTTVFGLDGSHAWLISDEDVGVMHPRTNEIRRVDLATGSELARRAVGELTSARRYGNWLVLVREDEIVLVPSDLSHQGTIIAIGEGAQFLGVDAGVVVVWRDEEIVGVEIPSGRVLYHRANDPFLVFRPDAAPLLIGTSSNTAGTDMAAMRVADGTLAWHIEPFATHLIDSLSAVPSRPVEGEVHMRAETYLGGKRAQLVARIEAATGRVLALRPSTAKVPLWLPDFGAAEEVEVAKMSDQHVAVRDGAAMVRFGELVVIRENGLQRVALPPLDEWTADGDCVAAIGYAGDSPVLIVVPFPAADAGDALDLALAWRGQSAGNGDALEVFTIHDGEDDDDDAPHEAPSILKPLLARAARPRAQLRVPDDVAAVCRRAEGSREFREALVALLGVTFYEAMDGEGSFAAIAEPFVPILGNEDEPYVLGLGGRDGQLLVAPCPDGDIVSLGYDFTAALRRMAAETPGRAATAAFVVSELNELNRLDETS